MSHIKTEIYQIFNNSKVGDLYSNSYGGNDMIYIEIEKNFTFKEIYELMEVFQHQSYLSFLLNNELSNGLMEFFKKFERRCSELYEFYEEKKKVEYLNEMLENNKEAVIEKFPNLPEIEAKARYAIDFLKQYKQMYNNTYDQSQDFFNNPSSYI